MSESDAAILGGLGILGFIIAIFLFVVLVFVLTILPFWKILSKAGYAGALSLLMLIPIANIIILFVLAFSKWPIERRLEQLELRSERPL